MSDTPKAQAAGTEHSVASGDCRECGHPIDGHGGGCSVPCGCVGEVLAARGSEARGRTTRKAALKMAQRVADEYARQATDELDIDVLVEALGRAGALTAQQPQPILHEQTDDGSWICCCGDHLSAHAQGWRPIESAPKDGTPVLVYWTDHEGIDDDDSWPDVLYYSQDSEAWKDEYGEPYMEPSRWHSLPPAPNGEPVWVDQPGEDECWIACMASLTGIPLGEFPQPPTDDRNAESETAYDTAVRAFLMERGWRLHTVRLDIPEGYAIASGKSPRREGFWHSVVYRDGVLAHDPHPDRTGLGGNPVDEYEILIPLARPAPHGEPTP